MVLPRGIVRGSEAGSGVEKTNFCAGMDTTGPYGLVLEAYLSIISPPLNSRL